MKHSDSLPLHDAFNQEDNVDENIRTTFQPDFTRYTELRKLRPDSIGVQGCAMAQMMAPRTSGDALAQLALTTAAFRPRAIACVQVKVEPIVMIQGASSATAGPLATRPIETSGGSVGLRQHRMIVKRDLLWKPLFREFRRYVKAVATMILPPMQQFRKLTLAQRGNILMEAFKLPAELRANPDTALALFQLIDTHSVHTNEHIVQSQNGQDVRRNYLRVFSSSSLRDRERFFRDELICHLWSDFRRFRPDLIMAHLRSNPSTASEHSRFLSAKFLEDIKQMQLKVDFAILPQ